MRANFRLSIIMLGLCAVAACSADGPTEVSYEPAAGGIQAGYLSLTPTGDGISVTNQTSQAVHTIAVERNAAALFDWAPCTTGPNCPAHAPGTRWTIPWGEILGYAADRREYIVYWWYDVRQPDGTVRAGNIVTAVVTR
jgi:hypothetical protein